MSVTTACSCGCCNNSLDPACVYQPTGFDDTSCQEYLCSAGFYQGPYATPCTNPTIQPGDSFSQDDLANIWSGQNCENFYNRTLFTTGLFREASCDSLKRVQSDMNHFLQAYQSVGGEFTSDNATAFQQEIIRFCSDRGIAPGACDLFLGNGPNTTGYCSKFTRDQIASDVILNSMCGCYAPAQVIDKSSNATLPSAACDSICHLTGVVQRPDPTHAGSVESCSSNVCVIDDVNINLVDTSTYTAFQQICGACTETNPCTCFISGVNVNDTMNKSGIGPIYNQVCGPENAQCFNTSTGTAEPTTCPPATQFVTPTTNVTFPIVGIMVVVFIIIIFIVIFLVVRHSKTEVDTKELNEQQAKDLRKSGVPASYTKM